MNKFAAIAVLAASAAAVELAQGVTTTTAATSTTAATASTATSFKTYSSTFDMLPDEQVMQAMPQGEGRDHTDWSWHLEHLEEADKVTRAGQDLTKARAGEAGAIAELEELRMSIIEADEEHMRQCQLHREEEMNLYYQCTQNDINNYALHHFGGEVRSYPRWVKEYNVCIDHIHRAKTLHLDFFLDNGSIEKRPCDPQSHGSTTYIDHERDVVVAPVIEVIEPVVVPAVTVTEPIVAAVVDKMSIGTAALNPKASCMDQAVPNWSGIWIEIWGGAEEAAAILSGKQAVNKMQHAQRCYTITATGEQKADLIESWDSGTARPYDLTLKEDNREYEGGCMIHTHLKGTQYTQWVSSVRGDISMDN